MAVLKVFNGTEWVRVGFISDKDKLVALDQTEPQTIIGGTPKLDVLKSKTILGTDAEGKIIEGTHQDLSGLIVKARIQFDGLNGFTTTVSRRGRTKIAKTTTTWEMTADASGSASVTIKKASYSNLPSTLTTIGTITLTTAQKATGSLSVALDAGDYLIFELTSCSGINELLVELF